MRPGLLNWQWQGYRDFHSNTVSLWLHLVAVPGFIANALQLLWSLAHLEWLGSAVSVVGLVVCFGVQALGHSREKNPSIPFEGPVDAVTRIFAEQFITFPRFVLSGRWWTALKTKAQ
jgi:uncharacterized membrane protein YGL010W